MTTTSPPLLGCIADDFTGASDLASFLVKSGMRTLQINGTPKLTELDQYQGFDALVIALKSRTTPAKQAISDSLSALKALQSIGCEKFYFKYCSTFDSTENGNIGPVTDALMSELNQTSTVICPALPVNGRTVYQGHLFVFDQPLNESSLKDHPLTPMRDSSITRLMEAQASGKATCIPYNVIEAGKDALKNQLAEKSKHYAYLVLDTLNTQHLETIGECLKDFTLITGGSGLATNIASEFEQQGFVRSEVNLMTEALPSPTLVISGSCSHMTQQQVTRYKAQHPHLFIDPFLLKCGEQSVESILSWLNIQKNEAPLIYATAPKEFVSNVQNQLGLETAQTLIEDTLAKVASEAIKIGFDNIVVAGGETSGAVVNALKVKALKIGKSIAPGVPMMQTFGDHKINLALKSGNFGNEDFFQNAVETLSCS